MHDQFPIFVLFTWHFRCPILTWLLELAFPISFTFPSALAHFIYEGMTGEEITVMEWQSDVYQKSNFNLYNDWRFEKSGPQTSREPLSHCIALRDYGPRSRCIANLSNANIKRVAILEIVTADTLRRRVQNQISTVSESVRGAIFCFKIFICVSAHLMSGVPLTLETGSVACPMTCIRVAREATRRGCLAVLWQERTRNRSSSRMPDRGGIRRL